MIYRKLAFFALIVGLAIPVLAENALSRVDAGKGAVRAAVTGRVDDIIQSEVGVVTERPHGTEVAIPLDLSTGWHTMRKSVLPSTNGEPVYLPLHYVFVHEKASHLRELASPDPAPLPEERDEG